MKQIIKISLGGILVALSASFALAQNPNVSDFQTCAALKDFIDQEGNVVMDVTDNVYRSFVEDGGECLEGEEISSYDARPTDQNVCLVKICVTEGDDPAQ